MESGGGLWWKVLGDGVPEELERWRAIWEMRWADMVGEEGGEGRAEGRVDGDSESGGGVELAGVEIGRAARAWAWTRACCGRVMRGL